jgi:hypothetical protein
LTGKIFQRTGNFLQVSGSFSGKRQASIYDEMSSVRERYGEVLAAHHEAWKQSELNQREYCEAQGIPLKAFGNWRPRFKAPAAVAQAALPPPQPKS